MFAESLEAPDRVQDLLLKDTDLYRDLGARLRRLDPRGVATIARGSSDHAANYAAYLVPRCTGRVVASLPPSVVTVLDARLKMDGHFALALSQSGGSPDLLNTLKRCRDGGALTASLVNMPGSALAAAAEIALSQHAGPEQSITATKSVLCTLTGIARVVAEWAQDPALLAGLGELPAVLREASRGADGLDASLLRGVSHAFTLSRGLGYGAATELALKLKETCGVHAEAFSTAEVRHGPREIVNKDYLVIAIAVPGSGDADVLAASAELKAQGARVITVGAAGTDFPLPRMQDTRLAPLAALQLLYPWIARSAEALGRNPDKPKTLAGKVIQTV